MEEKKEFIVTSYGKNIFPVKIENKFKMIDGISDLLIIGDQKPYCIALIWIDKTHKKSLDFSLIDSRICEINNHLSKYEKIKKWLILKNNPTIKDGELTANMKIKRETVILKYQEIIDLTYKDNMKECNSVIHYGKI